MHKNACVSVCRLVCTWVYIHVFYASLPFFRSISSHAGSVDTCPHPSLALIRTSVSRSIPAFPLVFFFLRRPVFVRSPARLFQRKRRLPRNQPATARHLVSAAADSGYCVTDKDSRRKDCCFELLRSWDGGPRVMTASSRVISLNYFRGIRRKSSVIGSLTRYYQCFRYIESKKRTYICLFPDLESWT